MIAIDFFVKTKQNISIQFFIKLDMSEIKGMDKKILEKYFGMEGGYVLDFSNRTMEEYFMESFGINIYSHKYDTVTWTDSKANRLRGIWREESDEVVGKIILSLLDYEEVLRDINALGENLNIRLKPRVQAIAEKLLKNSSELKNRQKDTIKSQNEYIAEIIEFFKKEYSKIKLPGLTYEYILGHNEDFLIDRYGEHQDGVRNEIRRVSEKKNALEKLKKIGVIKSYTIFQKDIEQDNDYWYDVSVCSIDESALFQAEQQPSQKIIHEHSHRFENDIQSNPIDIKMVTKDSEEKNTKKSKYSNLKWSDITLYAGSSTDEVISIFYKIRDGKYNKFDLKNDLKVNPTQDIIKIMGVLTLPNETISLHAIWHNRSSEEDNATFRQQISQVRKKLKDCFNVDDDPIISMRNGEYQPKFNRGGMLNFDDFDAHNSIPYDDNISVQF